MNRNFLTGFISDREESEVYGRHVALTELPDGYLLVNDDRRNTLWQLTYSSQ
ncbi:MAG: hypothetical protein WD398_09805 [Cyclobacteriaceae bacterium]